MTKAKRDTPTHPSPPSPLLDDADDHQDDNDDTYELRGCIGSLTPKRMSDHLYHYIRTSAFHDTRFTPIAYCGHNTNHHNRNNSHRSNGDWEEIISLRVSVSLLVQYETCHDCYDWIIGQHGIIIKLTLPTNPTTVYSATFLPEVAAQQSWDHNTTLRQLIYKSGYTGTITSSLLQSIHCTRYQSSKYTLTFRQYTQLHQLLQQEQLNHNNEDVNPILLDLITKMNHHHPNGDNRPPNTDSSYHECRMNTSGSSCSAGDNSSTTATNKSHHPSHPPNCQIM